MNEKLGTIFTGLRFENPFILASAPPTESEKKISNAFDAGWGGVVTKTIGLYPVKNVVGPRTVFTRASNPGPIQSIRKSLDSVIHSSWNWELISDKPMDWWLPNIRKIKAQYPEKMLIASIMAGSANEKELLNWQELARGCEEAGADALELNLSCPHMDRPDMGANIGGDETLISEVVSAVKQVAKTPVWVKLTPASSSITDAATACFDNGADAISTSNTYPSLPLLDMEKMEFEINVDGFVSSGGLGGPAILQQSLSKFSELTRRFPEKEFSGIGGISTFKDAFNYMGLGAGTVQICTAAMLDKAIGKNLIGQLKSDMGDFLESKGYQSLEDFRGFAINKIVDQSEIRRPAAP